MAYKEKYIEENNRKSNGKRLKNREELTDEIMFQSINASYIQGEYIENIEYINSKIHNFLSFLSTCHSSSFSNGKI